MDFIEVSHNGYAFMDDPVFHLRRVLAFKPGVWLIDDVLTGVGEHTTQLSFNFPPRQLEAASDTPGHYIYHGERISARIMPLVLDGLESRVLEGSVKPKGGWVSYGYAVKVPAPQLLYTKSGAVPTRFLTAVIHEGVGDVRRETSDADTIHLTVNSGGTTWRVTFGGESQQWTVSWA